MLGAIFTGLSGLTAYSDGLQTISNNVANLNSAGFKTTQVRFSDLSRIGSAGSSTGSGNHAAGGVGLSPPRLNFVQGELRSTANGLDLAVDGQGFMVLRRDGRTFLARTGQFEISEDGFISQQGTGYRLAGVDTAGGLVEFNVQAKKTNPPTPTTKITFVENLSASATTATVSDIAVFDSSGTKHTWTVKFTPVTGAPGEWDVAVTDEALTALGTVRLKFNGSAVDPATAHRTITSSPVGAAPLSVDLDFSSGVTSFSTGSTSGIHTGEVDGTALGTLSTIQVDELGKVKLTYSNGKEEIMGAVALMEVEDTGKLEQLGNGLFHRSDGAKARLLASGDAAVGKVISGKLEASNVDLAGEFGDLIIVQRGFQACSQVISVTNDMIQQLFGIRGQG